MQYVCSSTDFSAFLPESQQYSNNPASEERAYNFNVTTVPLWLLVRMRDSVAVTHSNEQLQRDSCNIKIICTLFIGRVIEHYCDSGKKNAQKIC